MTNVINYNKFLVKEHVGLFKAANSFDIFEPDSGDKIMECREPKLGFITKLLRFTDYKTMTPFDVVVTSIDGKQVVRITRGISLFISKVTVRDERDNVIGSFKQKLFSIGGKFDVFDKNDKVICTLVGKWTIWDFYFKKGEREYGHVSKEWAGIGKEMFTSADNYVLKIREQVPEDAKERKLILAAVLCIDMVLKE